ncbi:RraA family protein [Horticoccus luteus]|uniref:Putative 4-hydroxy-4-methyl-2-oxoglutarate aldolase n=1 Tax=Horticoccus luteus TaxID=2862869 RepID=A0A8F9XJ14_9BACT|nr:RraA family protein [Horticoccus luteus]QYM78173.1 RraA family protein [Horticoccus luteus]
MPLTPAQLHKLKRWNTPTIANALEQISRADPLTLVNRDETHDFMPEVGPMVGFAMTLIISGGDPRPKREQPDNFALYREYLASRPGPKIVVVQDLDAPRCHGSIWGEVGANHARALGCVGTITDGAVRDLDEMKSAGFKAIARRLAVSHAHCWPLRWGVDVEVFGTKVRPGQLIHADKHGFIILPPDSQQRLLEAARFMDDNECDTVIPPGSASAGRTTAEILTEMSRAGTRFAANARRKFGRSGEWK